MNGMQHLGTTKKGTATTTLVAPDDDPALLLIAANPKRISLMIVNAHATVTCFLNPTAAGTALTGIPLAPGEVFNDEDTDGAWYGITSASTGNLRVTEVV